MKRYILFLSFLLALTAILSSCKPDNIGGDMPQEGLPATVTLAFNAGKFTVETLTRSEIAAVDENKVHNLYVFVCNADGSVDARQFFTYDQLQDKHESATATTGKASIIATSGAKTIYAVANIGDNQPIGNITRAMLDAVPDKAALENLIVAIQEGKETILRTDGKMLMSGIIDATLVKGAENAVTLPLKRVCAKVKFTVQAGAGITFTPTSWEVVRVPKKVRLIENNTSPDGGVTAADDFFDTGERPFENGGNAFIYYQYENRKTPGKPIPGSGATAYALREKRIKTPDGGNFTNGNYEYADANATAIIIKGLYQKTERNGLTTTANVKYTIHTGYINNNANDFHALRNTYYRYTLTVNGVQNIILEARASSPDLEPAPGVEGQVMQPQFIFSFDAHYAQFVLEIPRRIANLPENAQPFHVHTPFDPHGTTDINWVKFFKNGVSEYNKLAAYPGEQSTLLLNVEQMIAQVKQKDKENAPNYFITVDGTEYAHFSAFVNEYYYEKDPMTKNAQPDPLLWRRFVDKPDREMIITGETYTSPDGASIFSSNGIVIRQKSITTTYDVKKSTTAAGFEILDENFGNAYSDDIGINYGNNSRTDGWANSVLDWYLIQWSGSPPSDPRAENHWSGTSNLRKWENFVNTRDYIPPTPATAQYGWGTYRLTGTNSYHNGGVNKARIACIARNRDLNGNGFIDKNEVRWYLPAIEQLVNMWIGGGNTLLSEQMYQSPAHTSALIAARTGVTSKGEHGHYLASNWDGASERSNPSVLWSEEGASIGRLKEALPYISHDRRLFFTRCVRNLGHTDPSVQPSPFATLNKSTRVISLVDPTATSHMVHESYRNTGTDYLTAEYPLHHERNQDNLPASKFRYAQNYLYGGKTYTWSYLRSSNPQEKCADYHEDPGATDKGMWRMPNQRELMLMWRFDVIGNDFVWCSTDFKFDPNVGADGRSLRAYRANNDRMALGAKNTAHKVRCVRDVK